MIAADQPTCFPSDVLVRVSSRSDGTMLDRTRGNFHEPEVVANRRAFCASIGVDYDSCVYQIILYGDDQAYDHIETVSEPDIQGVSADVLYTETPKVGLFLPVADCVATVIYDPGRHALALAHLGRHSTVAESMVKAIKHFGRQGSRAEDLQTWMAPSVSQSHYRMDYFDGADTPKWRDFCQQREDGFYLDLPGYNAHQAEALGVSPQNIFRSRINTATDPNYSSHSQGDVSGRFAVLAMMK